VTEPSSERRLLELLRGAIELPRDERENYLEK
jgi:hypothetical protein